MNEVLPMLDGDRPAKRPRVTLDRPTRGMPLALLVTIVCDRCGQREVARVDQVVGRETAVVTTAAPASLSQRAKAAGATVKTQVTERQTLDSITDDSITAYCSKHGRVIVPVERVREATATDTVDRPRTLRA